MSPIKGLTPQTESIIEAVSLLDCLKPYLLVGGTALSMQIGTRLSEDLDFMSWRQSRNEKREVNWPEIKRQFATIGEITSFDILDIDHIEFVVAGVKISFYANPNYTPVSKPIDFLNNIRLADATSIGAMKMEVMLRRNKFRDYYDIYSLLEAGFDVQKMIDMALRNSGHRLKSKNLISMLTNSERFVPDEHFAALSPIYNVTPQEIELRIKEAIKASEGSCR